jgi:hypothetical protein
LRRFAAKMIHKSIYALREDRVQRGECIDPSPRSG